MKWRIRSIATAAALVGLGTASWADTQPRALARLEALVVEMAETPAQHRALARYYRDQAEEHRELAALHREMARSYAAADKRDSVRKSEHCERLATLDEELADEYEALAKAHVDEVEP